MLASYAPLIYVVDDDDDDRELMRTIFGTHFDDCTVRMFDSGSGLLAHLTHWLDGRLPDLVILDLDMPIFNGFELLHYLKQDTMFQSIPVAVLSGSQQTEDIDRCFALGSIAYLTKVPDYRQLVANMHQLKQYWARTGPVPMTTKPKLQIEGLSFTKLPQN